MDKEKSDIMELVIRDNYEKRDAGRKCTDKQCKRIRCLIGKGFLRHIPDDLLRTYSYGKVQRLLEIAEANIHRM